MWNVQQWCHFRKKRMQELTNITIKKRALKSWGALSVPQRSFQEKKTIYCWKLKPIQQFVGNASLVASPGQLIQDEKTTTRYAGDSGKSAWWPDKQLNSNISLFVLGIKHGVWQKHPYYTTGTVKHGGVSIMPHEAFLQLELKEWSRLRARCA